MEKRILLDRIAKDDEERLLFARIMDKKEQSERRSTAQWTDFLSPAEVERAKDLLCACGVFDGYRFCGGYENAERCRLCFLPSWQEESDEDEGIAYLHAAFYESGALSHRDFLGSILALGLVRGKIGDIAVREQSCDIVVTPDAVELLLREWKSAGRIALRVSQITKEQWQGPEQKTKEIRDTVASLRLDAVIAVGLSTSRGKASEWVSEGRVQKNYRPCNKSDSAVAQGDVISVRGVGKFTLQEVGGLSKKGRIGIVAKRYL